MYIVLSTVVLVVLTQIVESRIGRFVITVIRTTDVFIFCFFYSFKNIFVFIEIVREEVVQV